MSKRENKVDKFIEYETSYKLAPGDKITFYCSNIGKGNLIGESITNNFNTVMQVVYSEEDNLLGSASLNEGKQWDLKVKFYFKPYTYFN